MAQIDEIVEGKKIVGTKRIIDLLKKFGDRLERVKNMNERENKS